MEIVKWRIPQNNHFGQSVYTLSLLTLFDFESVWSHYIVRPAMGLNEMGLSGC